MVEGRKKRRQTGVLAPGLIISVLCHVLAIILVTPSLKSCSEGEDIAAQMVTDTFAAPQREESLAILDEAPDQPEAPPEVEDRAETPPEVAMAVDQPKPSIPKKKPPKKRNKNERQKLVVDQPLVKEESEPPPEASALGPQDRKVAQETQPRKRSLEASPEAPPEEIEQLVVEAAKEKEQDEERVPARRETPKGNPEAAPSATAPAARIKTKSERKTEDDPSEARKRRVSGEAAVASAEQIAPAGAELEKISPEATSPPPGSPDQGHQHKKKGEGDFDLAAAMRVDPGMYKEMFGERDAQDRRRITATERRFLGRWQERVKTTRAALENFVPKVRYGNQLAINTRRSDYAVYIARIHRKVHRLWGIAYLRHLDMHYPMGHPMSNPRLMATIEFVIDSKTGVMKESAIVETSGLLEYDSEAIRVGHATGPHGPAPASIISPDGNVYVHWRFHRDTRQCGTFGVSVYVIEEDGTIDRYRADEELDDLNDHHPKGSRPSQKAPPRGRRVAPSLIER